MKLLVVGSGGREHALIWKLAQSPAVKKIYAAPGNGGISKIAECVSIPPEDISRLADFAKDNSIHLTVVGPEVPLANGIVDKFEERGLRIFGPSRKAAELEWSKSFAKEIMKKYHIPTAGSEIFSSTEDAAKYLKTAIFPLVVKADGLAAGKGVIICQNEKDAKAAIEQCMVQKAFGDAGSKIVIEEYLEGEEASILALTDGNTVIPLASSQDHKRVGDGDTGPNTGGMGAYSPAPVITEQMMKRILKEIIEPLLKGMEKEGRKYKGILYAGIMITKTGPKVLEFNVRFGDPETQSILPRLKNDLVSVLDAVVEERLSEITLEWDRRPCVCVVVASGGYPGNYQKDKSISGLDGINGMESVVIFHSGTKIVTSSGNRQLVTDGGRVLGVTAMGEDFLSAQKLAYQAIQKIHFDNMHYRKDIAYRAIRR
ncbi:MAG: phosphoribosylamine--glycine ligase [Candidatus Omnitrophica bacterium]|nr:phosphoribosylamine--glycine ligase [Candidatus Omnitrophota bacterium]